MSESFNPSDEFDLFQSSKPELTTRGLDSVYVIPDSGEYFDRNESRYTLRFRNTEEYKRLLNARLEVVLAISSVTVSAETFVAGGGNANAVTASNASGTAGKRVGTRVAWDNEGWSAFRSIERRVFNSQVEVVNNPRMVAQSNKILNANPDHVSKITQLSNFRTSTAFAGLDLLTNANAEKTVILYLKDVLGSIDSKVVMGEVSEISLVPEQEWKRVFLMNDGNCTSITHYIKSMRLVYDRLEVLPSIADAYRKQLAQPYNMKFINATHFKSNEIATVDYVWNLMTTDNSISKVVLFLTTATADTSAQVSSSAMKTVDAIRSIRLIFDEVQLPAIPYNFISDGSMRRAYLDMLDQSGKELSSPDSEPLLSFSEYNDNYQLIIFDLSHIDQSLFESNTSHQLRVELERNVHTTACNLNAIVYSHREVEVDTQRQVVRSIIGRSD